MFAKQSMTIRAPIEVVWQTLTEIEQWPRWQKAVSRASMQDAIAPSGEFLWTSGGMKIRSQIKEADPPVLIRWIGSTIGTKADHSWSLISLGSDTQVTTIESMSGWLVALIAAFNKSFLSNALKQTLAELKTEAERRHASNNSFKPEPLRGEA